MIGRLRGAVAARTVTDVLVEVQGVGYRVQVPPGADLPSVGEACVLHTHQYVREDVLALYGFPTQGERDLFELLLACQGVGPKVALACLSVLTPEALTAAVIAQDTATLTLVPGIGKRSAEKLVFELGPRLTGRDTGAVVGVGAPAGGRADVREALTTLGYGEKEVARVLTRLPDEAGDSGALLREALRILGGGE